MIDTFQYIQYLFQDTEHTVFIYLCKHMLSVQVSEYLLHMESRIFWLSCLTCTVYEK